MFTTTLPRIRHEYPSLYPAGAAQIIHVHADINAELANDVYLIESTSEDQKQMFSKWIAIINESPENAVESVMEQYKYNFHKKYKSSYFDLHSIEFQNFALCVTSKFPHEKLRRLSLSRDHADKRLLRARVYAIGSRQDISEKGEFLTSEDDIGKKKLFLLDHLQSFKLYDWFAPNEGTEKEISKAISNPKPIATWSIRQGTQETVEQIWREMGAENCNNKIAWVNFAASHNVCGSYSVDFGGAQEEEVATNCDGAVLLGTVGKLVRSGVKSFARGVWVSYKGGYHIPPGGNYCAKTTFFTGPQPVHSFMIATAFADFRSYIPFFVPYSERGYFFNLMGQERNREELTQRLLIDIEGVLKTCAAEGIHTLVTGASGCGAFHHDPNLEAQLWEESIRKLDETSPLQQVVFAVLDKEQSANWREFSHRFAPKS